MVPWHTPVSAGASNGPAGAVQASAWAGPHMGAEGKGKGA